MITYENQCVGCPPEIGCIGDSCKYKHVPILICDQCKDEAERLYWFGRKQLCEECYIVNIMKEAEEVELETL